MTTEQFQQIIVNRTVNELVGAAPKFGTLILDNDGQVLDETKEFVRLTFTHGPSALPYTPRLTIFAGVIIFDIFNPKKVGSGRLAAIKDLISDVFSHLEGDEFTLEGAGVLNLGKVRDSYQYQVSINFTHKQARQSRLVTVNC